MNRSVVIESNQIPFAIENLLPGSYTLTLEDSNSCPATSSFTTTITSATQIVQGAVFLTLPGRPGATDGSIRIDTIDGGTPFDNYGQNEYKYILLNDLGNTVKSGRLSGDGEEILGIGAGTYSIEYEDANECTRRYDNFAVLQDPDPIDFDIQVTRNCNDANSGNITINIRGGYPD